ncbi:glycoside hydrolase family 3 protein [Planomonospora venezuelensis]|uniref:Beta-N-acetylhexosaminidase n=1 Tax=Planomonospora venezuelensis TaxID=1999 RepID=A0A841D471_PLAVE|nr:glycoside hydrolase family 3 N-terminal domain-containing protein [Planomonospora venezuelensis]MBB5964620.1 beta-N-acetylhexosaminidase [Planomonospora venezuelensis]
MSRSASPELARLAATVLQPGFVGTEVPGWLRGRLAEGLGGVALYSRNIVDGDQLRTLTAALRAENPDVVIATDEEAGDVTRLEVLTGGSRPGNLALGAVDDCALTERVARDVGLDLAAAGVTLNYAPVVDVNSDLDNPVVGTRAFGDDPRLVARHTRAWITGLQSAGVAACAKHFPGHGATATDSHHGLPVVSCSAEELAATALPPYRAAVEAGVQAVMTGHLLVPAYDPDSPATMSGRILVGLLREELGFDGLIVTDGVEMPAVADRYGVTGAAVRALAAGADAICVGGERKGPGVVGFIRNAIVAAVVDGTLPEERLAEAASRVRRLAAWSAERLGSDRAGAPPAPSRPTALLHAGSPRPASPADVAAPADRGPVPPVPASPGPGLTAARRALRVTGAGLPLAGAPHVVEVASTTNIAIDPLTPWGVAAPLSALLPGTTAVRIGEADLFPEGPDAPIAPDVLEIPADRPLVLVVRDAHRHSWVAALLDAVLARRPDTVVVEMGLPGGRARGGTHVVTHGATAVSGQAAAELLAGAVLPEPAPA